jgi:hypothetical protein
VRNRSVLKAKERKAWLVDLTMQCGGKRGLSQNPPALRLPLKKEAQSHSPGSDRSPTPGLRVGTGAASIIRASLVAFRDLAVITLSHAQ